MKSKIFRLVLLFVVVLAAICVVPTFKSNLKSVVAADSEYEISITPKDIKYWNEFAYPNDAGNVYFTVKMSKPADTDVKVYYETRDRSAIANLGDYTAKSTYTIIPKNETSTDIVVSVGRAKYAVKDLNAITHSREFEVVLLDVEGLEDFRYGQQSAKGMIGYNYVYEALLSGRDTSTPSWYFSEYKEMDVSAPMTTDEIDGEGETSVNYDFSSTPLYSHWKKNFIDNGLAKLYATFKGKIDDWGFYTYWSYADLLNGNGDSIVRMKTEGYYDMEDLNPNNINHSGYNWYDSVTSHTASMSDTGIQTRYDHNLCCDCKNSFTSNSASNSMHCNFYEVVGEPNYTLHYSSEGGRDRKLVDTSIYSTIIDTTVPKFEGNMILTSTINSVGDTFRVALRFNEPVYMRNEEFGDEYGLEASTIKIQFNGDWDSRTELKYAGGNFTDTLYFEVPFEDLKLPDEKITTVYFAYGTGVLCDFAHNSVRDNGQEPRYVNNTINIVNLRDIPIKLDADFRVPKIDFVMEGTDTIQKQHSVTVNVSGVDLEDSKLYYSWEESSNSIGDAIKQKNYSGNALDVNTILGGGYSGKRYLHVYVETKYLRGTYAVFDTALSFDNTAPTLNIDSIEGTSRSRTFTFTVSDNFSEVNSGLKAVYMYYKQELEFEFNIKEIKPYGKKVYDDTFTYTVSATDFGISNTGNAYMDIGFYAVDNLGNKIKIDYYSEAQEYFFDNGNKILCLFDSINEEQGHNILISNYYDMFLIEKNPSEDLYITFQNFDSVPELRDFPLHLESMCDMNSGKEITTTAMNLEDDPTKIVVALNPTDSKGEFKPGYYRLRFYIDTVDGKYYSEYMYVYITEGKESETPANYLELNKQYVLNNYVYQLSLKYPNYYYLDSMGALNKVPYATNTTAASFSSYDKAYQYVYMKELLDLYGKKITSFEANYLNSGTIDTHRRAEGEDTIAKEGQIWIRYKRTNWDYIDQETSWVWYCYDETTSSPANFAIDVTVGMLPDLLVEALTTVSTKITKNGNYTHLVGSEHTDKYGAPKLNANQIHIQPEIYYETNCLTPIGDGSSIFYSGDPNITKSMITYNGEQYYLATNYKLVSEQYSKLYYRPSGSGVDYQKLDYTTGMTYGEAIGVNGLFDILEASVKGIKEYRVFIDRHSPLVQFSYVDSLGVDQKIELSQEASGTTINARTLSIDQIISEVDDLAYILVYKSSNLKLLDVITRKELDLSPCYLENDHYSLHIYDRSGNFYIINIRVNDSMLTSSVKEQTNEYITIETNREANQIQYFEVYLDGELLTNIYSPSLRLTKSGLYKINIRDWYGNLESIEHNFLLTLPTVEWKYEIDGVVYNYSEDNAGLKIQALSDSEYFILSKGLLQFTLKSGYSFEFIGDIPEHTHSYMNNRVKLKEVTMFTLKIYYTNNPHIYVTYNVSYDETAPSINASYIEKEYIYEELKYFSKNISNYQVNEILIPNELETSVNSSKYNKITDGQVFFSDLISVKFTDGSGLYNIKIYLDGELIKELVYGETIDEVSLSKRGSYKIVATDVLGNVGELNFVNKYVLNHQFQIDSINETVNNSLLMGNDSIKVTLDGNGEVGYLIKCDGSVYYLALIIKNGVIYRSYYYVGKDDLLNNVLHVDDSKILFSINEDTSANQYYDLITEGLIFKVMYDEDNNFTIHASLPDDKVYDYECRVVDQNNEPFIYRGSLSTKCSDIILNNYQNNPLDTNQHGQYIYISKEFNIDETQNFEEIDYIKLYYSLGNNVETSYYIFENNELLINKFNEDGFYRIEIVNIYGNVTNYYLAMSNTFITTSKVIDKQGNEYIYSKDYNEKLYSNHNISINAFSNNITYQVLKDGMEYNPQVIEENGQTIITLNIEGDYLILLKDEYGNEKVFTAEIKNSNLVYDEKLIYGYSEKAHKDYTNEKLSINHSLFEQYGISYVSVIYQGEEFIIYDLINEKEIEFDLESFEKCIGFNNKAGEYIVLFKDIYGNEMRKIVYYSDLTTLNLNRTTRSEESSSYDIEEAVLEGFWSNMILKFDSTSTKYVFKINGESLHLPYVLSFDNEGLADEVNYSIYYLDEYGFEYEFDAYLSRKDLEIEVLNTDVVVIKDLLTTKSNIKLRVEENTTVTYTIDGGDKIIYQGEELYIDGIYRIEVTDKAGNKEAVTIKKDTFAYYEFYNVGKSQVVMSGEVVNSKQVTFKVKNDDTSYIEKVFLNGVLLEKYNSTTFQENGMWEFIISDKMGNKSYFSFYQVLKAMQSFDYETPDYYKISEINYNSGNGVNISYMDYVTQNEINSHIVLNENGTYKIKMTSILDNSSKTFEIRIDNTAPTITLKGCEVGGSTKEDVIIEGYEVGDTVYIYKDGKLVSKTYISSNSITPPKIKEGGKYEIVVESEAGVQTVIEFQRDYILNAAGSTLIIILILATVTCLFAGLVFRNKQKVDN